MPTTTSTTTSSTSSYCNYALRFSVNEIGAHACGTLEFEIIRRRPTSCPSTHCWFLTSILFKFFSLSSFASAVSIIILIRNNCLRQAWPSHCMLIHLLRFFLLFHRRVIFSFIMTVQVILVAVSDDHWLNHLKSENSDKVLHFRRVCDSVTSYRLTAMRLHHGVSSIQMLCFKY